MKEKASYTELKKKALKAFKDKAEREAMCYSYAPGRVNIIGEHTDYNEGFVLPCAINFGTGIAAATNGTNKIRVWAPDMDDYDEFEISDSIEKHKTKVWSNYLRGLARLITKEGHEFGGFDALVTGNLPMGAGLASSASLEIAFANLINKAFSLGYQPQQLAPLGQGAEAFTGSKCGIMDQTASACGRKGHFLCIDCRDQSLRQIPIPLGLEIMIIDSNVTHQLVDGEYNGRRRQCESAAAKMNVKSLRDANMEMLEAARDKMDDEEFRRARHVITENERVLKAVNVLLNYDTASMSELMRLSHESMRDDFEITVKEIDELQKIVTEALKGRGGVRMTGGGFGGSVVVLALKQAIPDVTAAVNREYEKATGRKAKVMTTPACSGARFENL